MVNQSAKPSIKALKDIKLFKSFSDLELQQIINLGSGLTLEAQTNVVIEGELSWGLYLILEGTVGIYKTNKLTGVNHDVGQLKSGNFFGEMSLIDDQPRSATVKTVTQTDLFFISKDSFNQFLNRSTETRVRFLSNCISDLVNRLRELDDNYVVSQYQLWQIALKSRGENL